MTLKMKNPVTFMFIAFGKLFTAAVEITIRILYEAAKFFSLSLKLVLISFFKTMKRMFG